MELDVNNLHVWKQREQLKSFCLFCFLKFTKMLTDGIYSQFGILDHMYNVK